MGALVLSGAIVPTPVSAAASPITATARIQQAGSIRAPDGKQATAQVSVPEGDAYQVEVRESACPVGTAKPSGPAEVEQCRETILILQ